MPQDSVLGPFLFNIFLNHLLLFTTSCNLGNYGDDYTLYASGLKLKEIKQILHCYFENTPKWVYENYMMLNQGKCRFMCLERNTENKTFVFKNNIMKNNEKQKILGIIIDKKLTFKSHVKNLCKKNLLNNLGCSKNIHCTKK